MARKLERIEITGRFPDDVEVSNVRMPVSIAGSDIALLDESEQERAAHFHRNVDRVRYATTRATLRTLLGGRVGIEPASLRFAVTHRGKTELANGIGRCRSTSRIPANMR